MNVARQFMCLACQILHAARLFAARCAKFYGCKMCEILWLQVKKLIGTPYSCTWRAKFRQRVSASSWAFTDTRGTHHITEMHPLYASVVLMLCSIISSSRWILSLRPLWVEQAEGRQSLGERERGVEVSISRKCREAVSGVRGRASFSLTFGREQNGELKRERERGQPWQKMETRQ